MSLNYKYDWGLHPESNFHKEEVDYEGICLKLSQAGLEFKTLKNARLLTVPVKFISRIYWLAIILFISAIAASYYAVKEVLLIPSPIKTQDLRRFSENRVINLLDELTKEEEIDLNLFLDRLNVIKSVAEEHYINQFKMFIHEGTSCIGTEVECFKKSGNIVTLIKSKYPASNVFLIHCGFSIGTSEFNKGNPIPCLMLMDTLQTFVFSNRTIYNDILFSFNILGEPYKDDSFAYLIKEFNVNAVVNLTGTDGREVLISEKPNSLASIYLDNAEYAPANSLVEGIFTSGKSRESNESDFISLEIFYPPSTKDFEQVMKHGKSGLIQRAGENLFSFIFALSQIQDIYHRQLELFSRTYFPSFENHGFPILRYKSHSLYSIPGAVAELIGFIVVLLIIIGLFAVGYFRICNQRQLVFTQVLTYYGISIGCVLFTNVALYLFSGLFNYIPFIPWDNGIIFLRNTLLHFVLSMAIFFKMSESIETKYLIDYEQIYFTFGIFAPLILLAIVSSTIYVHRIGYYFLIVTIPLIVVTYYVRKPILGFSRTHACPKIIPIILVFTLLPTIVLTTDTVISIFQSVRFAERENCNFVYSAILGLLPAFLLSGLPLISDNLVTDWGGTSYIPLEDCPWMSVPKQQEEKREEEPQTWLPTVFKRKSHQKEDLDFRWGEVQNSDFS